MDLLGNCQLPVRFFTVQANGLSVFHMELTVTQFAIFQYNEKIQTNKMSHIKCCQMPIEIDEKESWVYRTILENHCQQNTEGPNTPHQCQGAITISAKAITLRCKLCGDAKGRLAGKNQV